MYFTSLYGHILWISHCMLLNVVHLLKIRFFSINIWVLIPKSGLSSWAMTMHICVVKCVFSSLLYSFHPSISSMLHISITEKCFIAGKSLYAHFEPPKQEIANTVNNRKKKFFRQFTEHQIHRHHNALSKQIDSVYLHWHWLYGHWVVFHLQWMLLVRVCVLSRLFVNSWDFPYFS